MPQKITVTTVICNTFLYIIHLKGCKTIIQKTSLLLRPRRQSSKKGQNSSKTGSFWGQKQAKTFHFDAFFFVLGVNKKHKLIQIPLIFEINWQKMVAQSLHLHPPRACTCYYEEVASVPSGVHKNAPTAIFKGHFFTPSGCKIFPREGRKSGYGLGVVHSLTR